MQKLQVRYCIVFFTRIYIIDNEVKNITVPLPYKVPVLPLALQI
jgi:hypothetical protein